MSPASLLDELDLPLPGTHRASAQRISPGQPHSVIKMRTTHHRLARLCAEGLSDAKVAAITSYTPDYVSRLRRTNPAFMELVVHYSSETDLAHFDIIGRQQEVGLVALEELRDRIVENPDVVTNRELLETVDQLITRPQEAALASGNPRSNSPSPVTIQFVSAQPALAPSPGQIIDATPAKVHEE